MSAEVCVAKARYSNIAESKDELSFRQGDIISVLQKETGMDDWWLCQAAGRVGLVPANYLLEVQPIPAVLAEDSIDGVEEHIYDHIPAEKNDILERRHSDNLSPFHRKEGEGLYDVPRRNLSSSALGLNAITLVGNRSQSPTLQDPLYDRPRAYSSDQTEPLYDYPKSNAPIYQVPPTTLLQNGISVSYTHLTLPTKRIV